MNAGERKALVAEGCWLCRRPLAKRVQWHHFVPKSRGGRDTVPVHPICHKTLHVNFTNNELEKAGDDVEALRANGNIDAFLKWVGNKPPDFHAPTRKRKN